MTADEARHPAVVTPTRFHWREDNVIHPDAARVALCAWAERHTIDPRTIAADSPILRDEERCRIRYTTFVLDDGGNRVRGDDGRVVRALAVVQGETPPEPWPDEVLALAEVAP